MPTAEHPTGWSSRPPRTRPPCYTLGDGDAAWLNDDRVGRALVRLFDADRASMLTELLVGVVNEFTVDTAEMHNAIDALAAKLASPKTRLKTRAAVQAAATTALTDTGCARWLDVTITETVEESFRQENRGRSGADTRYRRTGE